MCGSYRKRESVCIMTSRVDTDKGRKREREREREYVSPEMVLIEECLGGCNKVCSASCGQRKI